MVEWAGEWGVPGGPIPKNADLTYHIKLLEIIEDPDKAEEETAH